MIECANIPCESEKIDWDNVKKIGMKGWWGKLDQIVHEGHFNIKLQLWCPSPF